MLTRLPDALFCVVLTFFYVPDLLQRATTCRAWNRCMKKPEALPRRDNDPTDTICTNPRMMEWLGQCGVRWTRLYREHNLLDVGPFRAECIQELGLSWKDLTTLSASVVARLRPRKLMLVSWESEADLRPVYHVLRRVEELSLSFLGATASVALVRDLFDACPRMRRLYLGSPNKASAILAKAVGEAASQTFRVDLHLGLDTPLHVLSLLQAWLPVRARLRRIRLGLSIASRRSSSEEMEAQRHMMSEIAALALPITHIWLDDEVMSLPVELFPHLTAVDWNSIELYTRSDIEQMVALTRRCARSNKRKRDEDEDE